MSENFNSLFLYLEKEEIQVDKPEFLFQIQSHPNYPSILAITEYTVKPPLPAADNGGGCGSSYCIHHILASLTDILLFLLKLSSLFFYPT